MPNIESIVRQIIRELVPRFEGELRSRSMARGKEWFIEQVIRLTLDAHSLRALDRKLLQKLKAKERAERMGRLRGIALDRQKLREFLERYAGYTRARLIDEGYLLAAAPAKGTELITSGFRSPEGEALLVYAKISSLACCSATSVRMYVSTASGASSSR